MEGRSLVPVLLAAAFGRALADEAPPAPKWLFDVTRVAYTDLPNTQ